MPILNRGKRITTATHPAPARVPPRKRASDFRVPSPTELLPEIARLDAKSVEISNTVTLDRREIKTLEAEIAADDSQELHPAVAALLDGQPSPKAKKRAKLKELRTSLAVSALALDEIAKRRIALLQAEAGRAVCKAVRPEAERLVSDLVVALQVVDGVHRELGDLIFAVEAEGVSAGGLGAVTPYFLGSHLDEGRRINSYIREIKEAGYNV